MSYIGSWKIDDLLTFVANTQVFSTGVATDADSAPAYRVYEDETGTAILSGSMALLDSTNTAGFYSEQITLSAANGFEKGKCYSIYISATVSSVAGATHRTFQIEAEVDANSVSNIGANVITATSIAADAITAAKVADGTIDAATFAAGAINAAAIAADAIGASELAADAVAEIADAVWDEDATGHQTQGTFGQAIGDPAADATTIWGQANQLTFSTANRVDAQVFGIEADTITATAIATGAIDADAIAADAIGSSELAATAATEIAAAVWDKLIEDHKTVGTFGSAWRGLVLENRVIGSTGNDTTHIHLAGLTYGDDEINDYLLVIYDVSEDEYHSRFITDYVSATDLATVATLPFTPENAVDLFWLTSIKSAAAGSLTAAEVADAVWDEDATGHQTQGSFGQVLGDSGADADSVWSLANTNLDATVSSRASQASVDTIDDFVDTEVAAIKAKTDQLTFTTANRVDSQVFGMEANTVTASAIATDAIGAAEIADGAITAATFAAGAIDATAIANGAIDAATFAAGAIDAAAIATNAIDADALAADALAEINAEVVDALNVDTYAEPGQGNPAATAAITTKLGFLYKAWRNHHTQTATEYALFADDTTTKDQEAVVSDDGVTFDRGEVGTGA